LGGGAAGRRNDGGEKNLGLCLLQSTKDEKGLLNPRDERKNYRVQRFTEDPMHSENKPEEVDEVS